LKITNQQGGFFGDPAKRALVLGLTLFAATQLVYNPVNRALFTTYDDPEYVTKNYRVTQGLTLGNVRWAFTTFKAGNWHPLTWLSHMVDVDLFGLKPVGHHWMSLLIHALNAGLLFWLLWRGTGHLWRSLMVAALFALHPLNVESVAWVAERKNVLSTLFGFLTIAAYGWYARSPNWKRYALVASLFAASLMAKAMLVTLPFVLLLLDFWPLARLGNPAPQKSGELSTEPIRDAKSSKTSGRLLLEKIPLLVLAAASSIVTVKAQHSGGTISSMQALPLGMRIQNALNSYWAYLFKMFWPTKLAVLYPLLGMHFRPWLSALYGLALAGFTLMAWKLHNRRGYLLVGWFWYLGTLVPVIGLVQVGVQSMADRYTYVPLIGPFVMIAWSAAEWCNNSRQRKLLCTVTALISVGVLGLVTRRQLAYWHDSFALFERAVAVTQNNYLAHDSLTEAYMSIGDPEAGMRHIYAALAINPHDNIAHYNLGTRLLQLGKVDEAMREYGQALSQVKDEDMLVRANNNLGVSYLDEGNTDLATKYFREAIRLDQYSYNSYAGLGVIAYRQNRLDEAVDDFNS
jgi:protein O-mannosyl-transferase